MSRARQEAADREAEEEQRRRDEARAGYGRPAPPSAPVPAPAPVPTRAPVAPPPSRPSAFEEDRRRADEARRAEEERRAEEDRRAREREEADRRAQDEERRRADERREAEERDRVRREREAREAEERDRARREAEDRERARKEAEEQERARAAAAAAASAAAAPPAPKASSGVRAKAVYDYDKAEDNEISFSDGEIITDIEKVDEGWWKGRNAAGEVGLFPSTYVEEIHEVGLHFCQGVQCRGLLTLAFVPGRPACSCSGSCPSAASARPCAGPSTSTNLDRHRNLRLRGSREQRGRVCRGRDHHRH